ncbi:MAG: hypothetical protein JJU10_06650 [Idiomarina sp.]|nr:hypothetical protein [Idiomarina sp.]
MKFMTLKQFSAPLLATAIMVLILAQPAGAEERGFQEAFTGIAILGDGTEVEVNFPLAFEEVNGRWHFRAGRQRVAMSSPPEQYNLQLAVLEEDALVYIHEFADRYMTSFNVRIGEHELELQRTRVSTARYGIRVRVDDRLMIFERRTPTISIRMDENGIIGIATDGFLRDLSSRRVD